MNRIKNIDFTDYKRIPKKLYHYTSVYSLHSILTHKELWFGDTSTMNDKSELTNFVACVKREVLKMVPEKEPEVKQLFTHIYERVKTEYPFAFCFSTLYDDASQWERYGDNAQGVCIEFDVESIKKIIEGKGIMLQCVFYDNESEFTHQYSDVLKEYVKTGALIEGFSNITGVEDGIILSSSFHKHNSFFSEQEYRLLTFFKLDPYSLDNMCGQIVFSQYNNQIKKHLIINFDELLKKSNLNIEQLITKITLGPRSVQSESNLKEFLMHIGLNKLSKRILLSKCPLR